MADLRTKPSRCFIYVFRPKDPAREKKNHQRAKLFRATGTKTVIINRKMPLSLARDHLEKDFHEQDILVLKNI